MSKKGPDGKFLKRETPKTARKVKRIAMKTANGERINLKVVDLPAKKKSGIMKIAERGVFKKNDRNKSKREELLMQKMFVSEYLQTRQLEKAIKEDEIQNSYARRDTRKRIKREKSIA